MAFKNCDPIQLRRNTWSDDGNGEEDHEKRKLKEEIFTLRKKLESMALDKAALVQATLRYRAERNDFECKIRKEKIKIFCDLRKKQTMMTEEHQKELESMMGQLSVQNVELVGVRAQLSETMDMLNEFLTHLAIQPKSMPNQIGEKEHQSRKIAYESPLKNCSSIANCAKIIAAKRKERKFQRFGKIPWLRQRQCQPRNFKCEKCPLRFLRLAHLRCHIRVDHRKPEALQTVVTGCRLCGLLFKTREEHQLHVIMIHINDCKVDTLALVGLGNTEKSGEEVDESVDVDIED